MSDHAPQHGQSGSRKLGDPPRMGVWKISKWNWAYQFMHPRRYPVFGCGFATRERAQEAMREAKERRAS